jgi:hypothetical protein
MLPHSETLGTKLSAYYLTIGRNTLPYFTENMNDFENAQYLLI